MSLIQESKTAGLCFHKLPLGTCKGSAERCSKKKREHDGCIKHKFESFFYVLQFIIYRHNSLPFFLYMMVCTFKKGLCLIKNSCFMYFWKRQLFKQNHLFFCVLWKWKTGFWCDNTNPDPRSSVNHIFIQRIRSADNINCHTCFAIWTQKSANSYYVSIYFLGHP